MFIPFGYSTAYGLIAGIMVYTAINGPIYLTRLISRGRFVPDDEDNREYWSLKPQGRMPWFITATQAVTGHFGRNSSTHSLRSGASQENFAASRGSNKDVEAVAVELPPRGEKR